MGDTEEPHRRNNGAPTFFPISPQNPLLHLQWNISASFTWHAPPFLQGFGWQGLLPHSPTPLPYKLSPPFSCRFSTRLLTSSMRMQPTRPVATAVCSLALQKKKEKKIPQPQCEFNMSTQNTSSTDIRSLNNDTCIVMMYLFYIILCYIILYCTCYLHIVLFNKLIR